MSNERVFWPCLAENFLRLLFQFGLFAAGPCHCLSRGAASLRFGTMRLRDHPSMQHRSIMTWPPAWIWIGGTRDKKPKGEVGILQDVRRYAASTNRCFLVIEQEQELYVGCIHLENRLLCDEIYQLLSKEIGQSLASVGALDIDALWTLTRYDLKSH